MISPKELAALAKTMHRLGIVSLKTSEVELVVNPNQPKSTRRRKFKPVESEPLLSGKGYKGYTDEELLAWSSGSVEDENAENLAE